MQGGQQFINLNSEKHCANTIGVVVHEALHALGFHHMHTHTKRDRYIKLYWNNILSYRVKLHHNYYLNDASKVSSFNTPYDFYSIMHYGQYLPNGLTAIKPKSKYKRYNKFMGQRRQLSRGDIQRINSMYDCELTNN